jgi:hypothetical protein
MRHAATGHLIHPLEVFLQPTAGVHTYKLTAKVLSGTGSFTVQAAATQPAYLVVEDVGT